jgi:hypothetical protein
MQEKLKEIEIGFELCLDEDGKSIGTVRHVAPGDRDELVIYVQDGGNFIVPSRAVRSAHESRVILDRSQLDERVLQAISHAEHKH